MAGYHSSRRARNDAIVRNTENCIINSLIFFSLIFHLVKISKKTEKVSRRAMSTNKYVYQNWPSYNMFLCNGRVISGPGTRNID